MQLLDYFSQNSPNSLFLMSIFFLSHLHLPVKGLIFVILYGLLRQTENTYLIDGICCCLFVFYPIKKIYIRSTLI